MSHDPPAEHDRIAVEIAVEISDDDMTASISLRTSESEDPVTAEDVMRALRQAGVVTDEPVETRIEAFLEVLDSGEPLPDRFVVARGRPPRHGAPEEFTWDDRYVREAIKWEGPERVDFYTYASVITVEQDSVIGRITTPIPSLNGVDVKGRPRPAQASSPFLFNQTLERAGDDSGAVIARVSGRVVLDGRSMRVEELFSVPGDMGFETGNINSNIAVSIKGGVPGRFEVRSDRSITIGKSTGAAVLRAGGDVIVKWGIVGHTTGVVIAGGRIIAKFASEAILFAQDDIRIAKQIMNSRVLTGGRLDAARASVIGGSVFAHDCVEAASIGSRAGVRTRIVVGVSRETLREMAAADGQIHEACGSASEDSATRTQGVEDDGQPSREDAPTGTKPRVLVSGTIFAKASIQIDDRETRFDSDFSGPTSIEVREVDNAIEVVAVNPQTGSLTILPSVSRCVGEPAERCEPGPA